jgi:hypothetical protein
VLYGDYAMSAQTSEKLSMVIKLPSYKDPIRAKEYDKILISTDVYYKSIVET